MFRKRIVNMGVVLGTAAALALGSVGVFAEEPTYEDMISDVPVCFVHRYCSWHTPFCSEQRLYMMSCQSSTLAVK